MEPSRANMQEGGMCKEAGSLLTRKTGKLKLAESDIFLIHKM